MSGIEGHRTGGGGGSTSTPIAGVDGSAGAPTYSFANSTNTGMLLRSPANGGPNLVWSVNGTNQASLTGSELRTNLSAGITGASGDPTAVGSDITLAIRTGANAARYGDSGKSIGFYGATPVARAAAITTPTAPSVAYLQAEAASMKTAVDAIRVALQNIGITL